MNSVCDKYLTTTTVGALLLVLGGCAPMQFNTSSCARGPFYVAAGTNLVIAPPSGSGGTTTHDQLGKIGALIQMAATAVGHDYVDVKVIRLAADQTDDSACRREVVRYTWSGCSHTPRSPTLIRGEPVTVVWPNAVETPN